MIDAASAVGSLRLIRYFLACVGGVIHFLLPLVKSIALPPKSNHSTFHNTWIVELKRRALYSHPNALLPRYYSIFFDDVY